MRMPYCNVNGIRIHYDVSGEGRPLVLIHANPFDRRLWMYQVAHFSTFFKVVSVDLRSYGYSDKPTTPTSVDQMAEDVVGVCRQEAIDKTIVAGISVGGGLTLQLGLDHPELCEALIVVGSGGQATPVYGERIRGYGEEGVESYHIQHLRSLVSKEFSESRLGRYLLSYFTDWDQRLSGASIAEIFKALQKKEVTDRLGELKVPVLTIAGEHDNARKRNREVAQKIAGAVHHMIPGTGHACCLEDPVTFDEIVLDFLKSRGLM